MKKKILEAVPFLIVPLFLAGMLVLLTSPANSASFGSIDIFRVGGNPVLSTGKAGTVPTQDAKDIGRTFVILYADGVTPAVSDTAITFAKNVGGTVTGSQTTYAITSGKVLRVQSICGSFTAGAAANIARIRVRLNTGGACLVGSGLLLPAMELAPEYGTATAAEGGSFGCIPIPDGLELSGATWNVCFSESATAASGTLTLNLVGYEYTP